MTQVLEVESNQNIAIVRLSRPDKLNALNMEAFEALINAGRALAHDRSLRAVVLCGAGEHFCAGIDTSVFQSSGLGGAADSRMAPMDDSVANFFQRAALVWRELPVPVIAALHGVVYGAGLQIAMGADFRIAAPSTRCSVMEVLWGIIPDMGISATLRSTVRLDLLRELVYTGRIVEANEAQAIGLVSSLNDEPLAAAKALAQTIASNSPDAVRAAKLLLNGLLEVPPQQSLRHEALLQSSLIGQANQLEAVRARLERRAGRFQAATEADVNPD
ncbi:MAG: crotonase/enoyl-CoA hydratase family protein [Halioglobus sp.]|nr:crotonase/enoyl-CoA hydratase family protein [Halioglobus sp.]